MFWDPVWCLQSWFFPAQTLQPITCCGSKRSRNQLGRNSVVLRPKVLGQIFRELYPQIYRELSGKDFPLTCTTLLSAHFASGSPPHSSAQDQFLPGILELLILCQPVPVPPWDFTQEYVRMLLLFLPSCSSFLTPSSVSQKTLPTSQIFPKAGISRQYCSKYRFFFFFCLFSPSSKSYPLSPLGVTLNYRQILISQQVETWEMESLQDLLSQGDSKSNLGFFNYYFF